MSKKRVFDNSNEDYIPLTSSTPHSSSSSTQYNQSSQTNSFEENNRHKKRAKSHSIYGDFKLYHRLNEVFIKTLK
jgi:hypothetical protein